MSFRERAFDSEAIEPGIEMLIGTFSHKSILHWPSGRLNAAEFSLPALFTFVFKDTASRLPDKPGVKLEQT